MNRVCYQHDAKRENVFNQGNDGDAMPKVLRVDNYNLLKYRQNNDKLKYHGTWVM